MWTGVRVPVPFTSLTSSSSLLVIHRLRNGPAKAERNVRGWPAESMLRTGAPADGASRREAGARRLAARVEGGAPAERAVRRDRGARLEGAGEERLCRKQEREKGSPQNDFDWSKKGSEERTQKRDEKRQPVLDRSVL